MAPGSYFLELKEYCEKPLILDYQIEEINYEFFNTTIKTNKWVDFKIWLKIHEKLKELLQENGQNLNNFSKEEFLFSNDSIKIVIVKDLLDKNFAKIFNIDPNEIQPFIIRIYIEHNKNNALESRLNTEEIVPTKNELKAQLREFNEYDPLSPSAKLTGSLESDFVPYKPSTKDDFKIETSKETHLENDPYSPKPIDGNDLDNCQSKSIEESPDLFSEKGTSNIVPKYKASPILNKSAELQMSNTDIGLSPDTGFVCRRSQRSPRRKMHTDIGYYQETRSRKRIAILSKHSASNGQEEKKKTLKTTELFGSDDSDVDAKSHSETEYETNKNNNLDEHRRLGKCKTVKRIIISSEVSDGSDNSKRKKTKQIRPADGQKANLDKWLNSNKIPNDKHNVLKHSKKSKLSPSPVTSSSKLKSEYVYTIPPIKKLTDEERRLKREQHEREINALNEFNNQVRLQLKSPPNLEFKSLNHIPIVKILKTFTQYKLILDKHFNEYKAQKSRHIRLIEGLDHLALINVVDDDYQYKMLNCLKDNYEIPDDVPRYTELFMLLMLPEWILALFMNEYNLTRENAIKLLKDQEDSKICSQLDNSIFNFSTLEKM